MITEETRALAKILADNERRIARIELMLEQKEEKSFEDWMRFRFEDATAKIYTREHMQDCWNAARGK